MTRPFLPGWLLLLACATGASGQQAAAIHVLLLNGNNGKPLEIGNTGNEGAPLSLTIFPSCGSGRICFFPGNRYTWGVNSSGHAELPVIDELQSLTVSRPTEWFMYCQGTPDRYGALPQDPQFSVDEILRHGVVAPDSCNERLHIQPQPGQLIFFLRPLSWWEQLTKRPQM
jgi:hypothetical protein